MANEFEELLKGQEIIGTMGSMSGITANKVMHMMFIVDTSGSMSGDRIDKVNEAFREMVPILQGIQREVNDAFELYISILTFGSYASWKVTPTPILEYAHQDLDASDGGTNYGKAFRALESKLTQKEFMAHHGKIAEPYIMFMTDGHPNDSSYNEVLTELRDNLWYRHAQRYAVLIGKNAISSTKARSAVEEFVSDKNEGIVTAADAAQIISAVSAKTIHTIKGMTLHKQHGISGDEISKGGSSIPPVFHTPTPTDNPFGKEWDLDPNSIYGGNFNF